MSKLIIIPIETIESRYTGMWNKLLEPYADIWIYPKMDIDTKIEKGEFLDINKTSYFKSKQLQMISNLFMKEEIKNGDIFFIADIFFPGIEMIRYMADLQDIKVKIFGYNHAGRADKTDFVQKLGDWSDYSEKGYHEICDGIFVGSKFQKSNVNMHFDYPKEKIHVTGAIWNLNYITDIYQNIEENNSLNAIIWPHRICKEKGFDMFLEIVKKLPDKKFFITSSNNKQNDIDLPSNVSYIGNLTKAQYYKFMNKCKWYLSTAHQETFGYTIQEAIYYGCNILAPSETLVHNCIPEMLPRQNLYSSVDEAVAFLNSVTDFRVSFEWTRRFHNNHIKMIEIMKGEK